MTQTKNLIRINDDASSIFIDEVALIPLANRRQADVQCSNCHYCYKVEVKNINWITYLNPNYDLIVGQHKLYMPYLELCPEAIRFMLDTVRVMCCPHCSWGTLHISPRSKYSPENIKLSLGCHAKS